MRFVRMLSHALPNASKRLARAGGFDERLIWLRSPAPSTIVCATTPFLLRPDELRFGEHMPLHRGE